MDAPYSFNYFRNTILQSLGDSYIAVLWLGGVETQNFVIKVYAAGTSDQISGPKLITSRGL